MAKIKFRRDTAANWTDANPVLAQGEPGFEHDTGLLKIGDGETAWVDLGYLSNSVAEGDPNVWIQTFESETGAPTDVVGVATSVEYDADGNVIALFSHYGDDNTTYYSVGKFNTEGTRIWAARFTTGFITDGWGIAVDSDAGAVYIAGTIGQELSYNISSLNKISLDTGAPIWTMTYDFGSQSASPVVDVAVDGSPVMVGYAGMTEDAYITTTKINSEDGSIAWSRKLDGQQDDEAYGMAVGPNGEVVVIGYIDQLGINGAATALYTEPTTNTNWVNTVEPINNTNGVFSFDVTITDGVATFTNVEDLGGNRNVGDTLATLNGSVFGGTDGVDDMVVKVGETTNLNADDRMLVVKYNSSGTIQWQKAVLFDEGFDCEGADADIDSNGNIYVTGSYQYFNGDFNTSALSILKLDSNGDKQWSRRVVGNCDTFGVSVVVGQDDKLYLSGMTANNGAEDYIWVVAKYGFDGTVEWQRLIDNTTTWSFTGGIFFNDAGGSTIAVKQNYVALSGGFGNPGQIPHATLVQVSAAGDTFSVGDWDFKAATFSGTLYDNASDIIVEDAGKTDTDNTSNITSTSTVFMSESGTFLIGTLYNESGSSTGNITFSGNQIRGTDTEDYFGLIELVPSVNATGQYGNINFLDEGQFVRIYPTNEFDTPHIHIAAGSGTNGTGDLFIGDDNKYLQVNNQGYVEISSYNDNTTTRYEWAFQTDGSVLFPTLTVPISDNADPSGTGQTLKFSDPGAQAIIYGPPSNDYYTNAERVIIQGAPGYIDTTGEGGDVYLWAGPGGSGGGDGGDIKIRAGRGQLTGNGGYLNFQAGASNTGTGGWINIESGSSENFGSGGDITIDARSGGEISLRTRNSEGNTKEIVLDNTGTTTFPGAVVKSTVAKIGIANGVGPAATLSDAGGWTDLIDGNYGPFTLGPVTFNVVVTLGLPSSYTVISTSGNSTAGDFIGTLNSADMGGAGSHTSNVTVDTVTQATTAIDLTRSINKLTAGNYTLADGVEGQIMYLVPQDGMAWNSIDLVVAHGRPFGDTVTPAQIYPDIVFFPFSSQYEGTGFGVVTMIFTDGAWQSSGGTWD